MSRSMDFAMNTLVRIARSRILLALDTHKQDGCRDPECKEPVNVVAFIAHSVGLAPDQMPAVADRLREYQAAHDACQKCRALEAHTHDE